MEAWGWLAAAAHELTLFACIGFLIGGLDDLLVDLAWLTRTAWRRLFVYSRHARATVATLTPLPQPTPLAIFVPAWDESEVIARMLVHALRTFGERDYRIYVGVYPNDRATRAAVAPLVGEKLRLVVGERPGPTTKADCLNTLWRALCDDEVREGVRFAAIVLHDAEDVVHPDELTVYAALAHRFDLVQLPVAPLPNPYSRWVAGTYIDEFAEHHGKTLIAREAFGAAVPSAGVGCAFSRTLLGRLADSRDGRPFDAGSLTEDYELGLRIAELGGRAAFVRINDLSGQLVAIHAHFPATLASAVRQKARWIAGIALHGWDRLEWHGGLAERWMRLRDRRTLLAALVLLAAYAALVLGVAQVVLAHELALPLPRNPWLDRLLLVSLALLLWRLLLRALFVWRSHGGREALRSIPRALVSNLIALLAARRAVALYLEARREGRVRWDKTAHIFPDLAP